MIPKIIHYCWLSNDPIPQNIKHCIDSWKKILPDYEIRCWDLKKFPLQKHIWVKQAFEKRKYAFAADYIRLYALATEGGIYLDSDVEVIKSFNDLLHLPYFICLENSPKGIEAATIGAEANTPWILECLSYYENKSFIDEQGRERTTVLPEIIKKQIEQKFKIHYCHSVEDFINKKNIISVLPKDYFSPKNYVTKKITITKRTYSIHHFAGTWQPTWKKVILKIWVPFSVKFPQLANFIKSIK